MSIDIITTKGHIDVRAISSEVDPLLKPFDISISDGITRLDVSEASLPTFEDAAAALKDSIWVTVEQQPNHVAIMRGDVVLAEGQPMDELSLIDVAKVIEHDPDSDVIEAVETMSWIDGDTGGSAAYHGTHFSNYTDTAELCDEGKVINEALAKEDYEEVAGTIAAHTTRMLEGIRNEDQRSAVALELLDIMHGVCTDQMQPEDIEAAANRF